MDDGPREDRSEATWETAPSGDGPQDASGAQEAGLLVGGRYRLDDGAPGGSGAFGRVWRATDLEGPRTVAVKIYHGAGRRGWGREVRALEALRSPRVLRLLDHGEMPDGRPYVVTDWIEGETLADRVDRWRADGRAAPPPAARVELFLAICEAVASFHRPRATDDGATVAIVHRDLKPSNIMLGGPDGRDPTIIDFNVALVPGGSGTRTVDRPGTRRYQAPEQAHLGLAEVSPATDVFALGVVLCEMLTLSDRVPGTPATEWHDAAYEGRTVRRALVLCAPDVPWRVQGVLLRALARHPGERYPDAAALAAALRPMPWTTGLRERARWEWSFRRARALTATVLLGAMGAALPLASRRPDRAGPARRATHPARAVAPWVVDAGRRATAVTAPIADAARGPVCPGPGAPVSCGDGHGCPVGMRRIPGGRFPVGEGDDAAVMHSAPAREVQVPAFCIGCREVAQVEYEGCVSAGACTANLPDREDPRCVAGRPDRCTHPANCTRWIQAARYCQWTGGRLPSEIEWEIAARGAEGRRYPWGDEAQDQAANVAGLPWFATAPVGAHPLDRSPFGAWDMAGNVREWVVALPSDGYPANSAFLAELDEHLRSTVGGYHLTRGGDFGMRLLELTFRDREPPAAATRPGGPTGRAGVHTGFRCAADPTP